MHTIKLSNYANNAAAVEAAILLSARDAGARVVLQSEPLEHPDYYADLHDRLLAESDQNAPAIVYAAELGIEVDEFTSAEYLRFHGHTSAGHPWEVVLL